MLLRERKKEYEESEITLEIKNKQFYESIEEEFFNEYGLNIDLYYSLGYSQGDGLSFECDDLLSNYMIDYVKKNLKSKKDKLIFKFIVDNGLTFKSNRKNNRYCYASKDDIDYDFFTTYLFSDYMREYPKSKLVEEDFENCVDIIFEIIQEWYMIKCKELEKRGYAEIYYEMSDEEFIEYCEANELLFLENGGISYE